MKNKIKPITDLISEEMDTGDILHESVRSLLKQFKNNVDRGKVKIDSVENFSKLANLFILLESNLVTASNKPQEDFRLSSLIDEEDESIKQLYEKLFSSYNDTNDELNKSN